MKVGGKIASVEDVENGQKGTIEDNETGRISKFFRSNEARGDLPPFAVGDSVQYERETPKAAPAATGKKAAAGKETWEANFSLTRNLLNVLEGVGYLVLVVGPIYGFTDIDSPGFAIASIGIGLGIVVAVQMSKAVIVTAESSIATARGIKEIVRMLGDDRAAPAHAVSPLRRD